MKVHAQTSGEESMVGEDIMEREKSDFEKLEREDVELVPGRSTRVAKKLAKGDKEKLVSLLLMN